MHSRAFALFAAVLITAPATAESPQRRADRLKQISEVVFQNYPARALAAGEQGPVFFVVKLDDKAHPTSCEVTHGSGYPRLDAETCELIVQHAVFKSVIGPNGKLKRSVHEGVVYWTIPGAKEPSFNPVRLGSAAPVPQICRTTTAVGYLYKWERTCLTQREWDIARAETQGTWGEWQGKYGHTGPNPAHRSRGCRVPRLC
jgi:periplasmic protein TonB